MISLERLTGSVLLAGTIVGIASQDLSEKIKYFSGKEFHYIDLSYQFIGFGSEAFWVYEDKNGPLLY